MLVDCFSYGSFLSPHHHSLLPLPYMKSLVVAKDYLAGRILPELTHSMTRRLFRENTLGVPCERDYKYFTWRNKERMLRGKRAWLCEVTSIWHLCSCFTILPELCFKDESHKLLFFWFPFRFQMNRISGQRGGKNRDFSFLCLLLIVRLLFRARVSLRS